MLVFAKMTQPNETSSVGRPRQKILRTSADTIEHLPKLYREAARILVLNGDIELADDTATHSESGSA
jgi:hypothetical protein